MIKKLAFVGYPVTDMKKSRAFYEGVLGLVPDEGFGGEGNDKWMEYTVGGDTIALGSMPEWKPSRDGACAAIEVDDFPGTMTKLKENNAEVMMEGQEFPTCHMGVVRDPDGNQILIHMAK